MIYDISVPLDHRTPIFPGDPKFSRNLAASLTVEGTTCNTSHLNFGAHTGTHIDAPLHMKKSGRDVSAIRPDELVGSTRVMEIRDAEKISVSELSEKNWASVSRVLFKTRNSGLWGGEFQKKFVYLEEEAAHFLADKKIRVVGIDYLSVERFGAARFDSHLALMQRDILILEGLDLSSVPEGNYLLFCGALKLAGSDGAPCRVFLVDKSTVSDWASELC
jgi:arylformamidase